MYTQFAKCCCNVVPPTPTTITISVFFQGAKRDGFAQTYVGNAFTDAECPPRPDTAGQAEVECIPGSPDTYSWLVPGGTYPLASDLQWSCSYSETNGPLLQGGCYGANGAFGYAFDLIRRTGLSDAEGFVRLNETVTFTKSTTTPQTVTAAVFWWNGTAYVNSGVSTSIRWNRETYALPAGGFIYKQYVLSTPSGHRCRNCQTATGSNAAKTGLSVIFNQQATYLNGMAFVVTLAAGQTGAWTIAVSAGSLVIKQNGTTIIAYALSAYTIGQLVTAINALAYANASMGGLGAAGGVIGLSSASQVQSMTTTSLTTGGVNVFVRKPGDPWELWQVSQRPSYTFGGTTAWQTASMDDSWDSDYLTFTQGFEAYIPDGLEESFMQPFSGAFGAFMPNAKATIGTTTPVLNDCSVPPVMADANCTCSGCTFDYIIDVHAWDVPHNGYTRSYTGSLTQYSYWSCKQSPTSEAMICDTHFPGTDCVYGIRNGFASCGFLNCFYPDKTKYGCFETATGQGKGYRYKWVLRRS